MDRSSYVHRRDGQEPTSADVPVTDRVTARWRSAQLAEQRLCLLQIGRAKALAEPAVDRGRKVTGFGVPALVAAEAGEAHGGAQFPELGLLVLGDAQGF